MPTIGIKYGIYKDAAYSEREAGVQNISVASRSNNYLAAIVGLKAMFKRQIAYNTEIIPSIQGSIEQNFNNKQQKVRAKFSWMDNYFENDYNEGSKANTAYNIGAALLTKHKNIELLASYNCHLRKKYQAHQGSFKLKLLF